MINERNEKELRAMLAGIADEIKELSKRENVPIGIPLSELTSLFVQTVYLILKTEEGKDISEKLEELKEMFAFSGHTPPIPFNCAEHSADGGVYASDLFRKGGKNGNND